MRSQIKVIFSLWRMKCIPVAIAKSMRARGSQLGSVPANAMIQERYATVCDMSLSLVSDNVDKEAAESAPTKAVFSISSITVILVMVGLIVQCVGVFLLAR